MSKVLSQEEIDALLTSVVTGKESESETLEKSQKKVLLYDFRRPNLISKEQMRLLENIHEGLARKFGVFLSAQLRMIVDMHLLAVDQIMYSEFVMSITSPGAIYVGSIDNPYSQIILEINPQLVIMVVEKLFGGKGDFISSNRPVSIIERKIMKRVVDRIAEEISQNWASVKDFKCSFTRFESNPEFVQIVSTSEPVIVVSIEINIRGRTSIMNICYPYIWISDVISNPEIQERILFGAQKMSKDEKNLIEMNMELIPVELRAVLGKSFIPVKDFINLKVGDVIRLNTKTNSKISIYANNRRLFNAMLGSKGKNYAFKIVSAIKGEEGNEN